MELFERCLVAVLELSGRRFVSSFVSSTTAIPFRSLPPTPSILAFKTIGDVSDVLFYRSRKICMTIIGFLKVCLPPVVCVIPIECFVYNLSNYLHFGSITFPFYVEA